MSTTIKHCRVKSKLTKVVGHSELIIQEISSWEKALNMDRPVGSYCVKTSAQFPVIGSS